MTQETVEPTQEVQPAPSPAAPQAASQEALPELAGAKLVPVNEAIKYRRRAQQAETRLQQVEQKLQDVQGQFEQRSEQLATAEAQRDELGHQLEQFRRRSLAERHLLEAGVADLETAMTLLEKRVDFAEDIPPEALRQAAEQLLQDKPVLTATASALPGKTASARLPQPTLAARVRQAASRAAQTGSRRAVGEYLRLRRQSQVPA